MSEQEYAQIMEEQDINNARHWEEENQMPVIDINTLVPSPITSEQLAEKIISNILEGNINPLHFAVKKKCIEDALERVMKDASVKDLMIDEINKYGRDGATALGATLTTRNLPKYDYSKDPTWKLYKDTMKPFEDRLKAQEERIKIACKTNSSLVSEDGEVIATVVPAPATTSIAVSFKIK